MGQRTSDGGVGRVRYAGECEMARRQERRHAVSGGGKLWISVIVASLGGCMVGPDYKRPEVSVPGDWSESTAGGPTAQAAGVARWWKTLGDPVLDSLVARAVESNSDLKIAAARIREARALRRIVSAGEWPTVNSSGAYRRSKQSESTEFAQIASGFAGGGVPAGAGSFGGFGKEMDLWQGGFDASWELDVFGGVRRAVEAADAEVAAVEESRRDVLVALLAEVGQNYVELRGLQKQIGIVQANVKSQQEMVELTRARFKAGLTGELDVVRAEAQVALTRSQLPVVEALSRRAIHRLGVLTGQWAGALSEELSKAGAIPGVPAVVPVGLPSELLRRRADVRRAERQVAAATARIGVATADLFPKFSLTGGIGLQSNKFKTLGNWDSRFWSIGPGVSFPVFDRGKIRANIQVQNARQEQALAWYENTVLRALAEVEDALVAYAKEQVRRDSLEEAVKANRRAVELASDLYTKGLADFLSVLEAQRSLYSSEEQLALSERSVSVDLVALYKALGGGWEEEGGEGK